jgi:hypothetical protein
LNVDSSVTSSPISVLKTDPVRSCQLQQVCNVISSDFVDRYLLIAFQTYPSMGTQTLPPFSPLLYTRIGSNWKPNSDRPSTVRLKQNLENSLSEFRKERERRVTVVGPQWGSGCPHVSETLDLRSVGQGTTLQQVWSRSDRRFPRYAKKISDFGDF